MKTNRSTGRIMATIVMVATGFCIGACSGKVGPAVVAGIDACTECNMVIDTVNQACGWVSDGDFVPFDSPGCLLRSYDDLRKQGTGVPSEIFFADYTTSEFVPVEHTVFLLTRAVTKD